MYRRDLVWHLREHHRKEHGFSDGQLVKEFVHMPKDLRKVICIKCSETEAHENAVWLAVDPNEVCGKTFNFKSRLFNKVHLWRTHVQTQLPEKLLIHFFINNYIANISLYALS